MNVKPFSATGYGNCSAKNNIVSPNENKVLPGMIKEERPATYNPFTGEKEYFDITKILKGVIKDEKPNCPKLQGIIY